MACRKTRRSWLEDFWSNIPAWITFWSTLSLYLAAARIFSSTLLTVQSRSTRTSFCWPIRWARSWAWRSWNNKYEMAALLFGHKCYLWRGIIICVAPTWWGFQSLSKMTTVSAACRFRPSPPALVLRRKMKYWDPSSLNFFSSAALSSDLVVPETSDHNDLRNHECRLCASGSTVTTRLVLTMD